MDTVPAGDRWIHEMKYDGYRILVAVGGGEARAYTRSGLDWSSRFPSILSEARELKDPGSGFEQQTDITNNFEARASIARGMAEVQAAVPAAPAK